MYKSKLQQLCHQYAWSLPEYVTTKDGPDHNSRFSTSITVNGVLFQTPPNQFRSSKESQNEAAKIAFDYFTVPKPILQQSINPTPVHPKPLINSSPSASTAILDTKAVKIGLVEQKNSQNLQAVETPLSFEEDKSCKGFIASTAILDAKAAKIGLVEQENSQTLQAVETPLSFEEDKSYKEMLHLYKSRLQNYAQKRNLTQPTYSCEIMGPPHARRFKSKVTIDGKSYETSNFFTNLKDAEHAAAKVAFESMSLPETQEDEGLYKSLLQELAQKGGFLIPTYKTDKSGPPHMPTFVSKVEIGGESFEGHKAKSKKLAEMNAAKAAYNSLIERRARQHCTVSSPDFHIMGALDVSSLNLQPHILDKVQPKVMEKAKPEAVLETKSSKKEAEQVQSGRARQYSTVFSSDFHIRGGLEVPSFNLQPHIMDEVQLNVVEKVEPEVVLETKSSKKEAEQVQSGRGRQYSTVSAPSFQNKGALEVSSFNLQPNVIEKVEPKVVLKINSSIEEQDQEIKKKDINGERHRKPSSSENEYAWLQGPTSSTSSTSSPPKDGPSLSSPSIARSDIEISAGAQTSATKRILVCARIPHLTIPDGATILPISDNEWVAMRLEGNHSH